MGADIQLWRRRFKEVEVAHSSTSA